MYVKINLSYKAVIFLFLLVQGSLHATNYYVSNSGNNSNTGLNLGVAFLTLQHASNIVFAGDTVFVENGIYVGFDHRSESGTATAPIVFMGLGNSALINQSGPLRDDGINIEGVDYIVIDRFICNNMPGSGNGIRVVLSDYCIIKNSFCDNNAERGIFTAFTDDILIENNVCTNSIDEHGIYVSNSSDRPIIRFNHCYGNNNVGIHMNGDLSAGGDGIISDAKIYNNNLHDNGGGAGINMDGLQNPIVYNNLIYNNHSAQGIAIFGQDGAVVTNGAKIYNNTIIVPTDGRWGILIQDGGNIGTEVYNNIIINQHSWRGCISVENITGFTSDYNIINDKMSTSGDGSTILLSDWQALGLDVNGLLADDPMMLFQDFPNWNFNLAENSQAIDKGTNLVNMVVVDDFNQIPRPINELYDIGAYEAEVVLAIDLVSPFKSHLENGNVSIKWTTNREKSSHHFAISRSRDGSNWDKIGSIKSNHKNDELCFYKMIDKEPLFGFSTYRLTEVDIDDIERIVGFTTIENDQNRIVNIYPNPTQKIIFVANKNFNNLEIRYQIYDNYGKIISTGIYDKKGINIEQLTVNSYYLRLQIGNEIILKKFIKK